jgi:glycosyltransferase involved in cell wall biosynthesis
VLEQDCQDFELIVVDDGSTDATGEVELSFASRARWLRQENRGPGAARNFGVKNSVGEYVAFLDSDDRWFPWTLAAYARVIAEQGRPGLICGALRYFHEETELAGIKPMPLASTQFPDYFTAGRAGVYCGSGQMAVRREILLRVGGFAEGRFNAEDHDLVMRLGTSPGFVRITAPDMIAYRQHAEAATRDVAKTFAGSIHLLQRERAGCYPGGRQRRGDRRRVLAQHLRPLSLELLRRRERRKAWSLYRRMFLWNLRLGKIRYLAGFLVHAAMRSP